VYSEFAEMMRVELTLYSDALVTRGVIRTHQRRVTDILNHAEQPFLVLEDVEVRDLGTSAEPLRAAYAQVNLEAVLFAVADTVVEAVPELRTPKVREQALISVPPFTVTGTIHLLPTGGDSVREALIELTGRFLPVTDAEFWSRHLDEPRRTAAILAVNHARTQILARLGAPGGDAAGTWPPELVPPPGGPDAELPGQP
jgi:hypothetical protein